MGGSEIGAFLRARAAQVRAPDCIVEIGTWLGAGTAHLALGAAQHAPHAPAPEVHTYDLFQARTDEVVKASARNIALHRGQDTLPHVRELLAPFGGHITFHKGDILKAGWGGAPIGLYVDDAAKTPTLFYHMLSTFAPFWVPGRTTVVLMDYRYWEQMTPRRARKRFRVQQDFVERHAGCFEEIHDPCLVGPVAAFRYVSPFPMGPVRRQAKLRAALSALPF